MITIKSNSRFIHRTRRRKACATKSTSFFARCKKFIGDYKFYKQQGATHKEAWAYARNSL